MRVARLKAMDKQIVFSHLAIGSRRTHGPDGEVATRDTVLCPSRGASIATDVCFECDRCVGPDRDAAAILCLHSAVNPQPHERAERLPTIATLMSRNVECVTRTLSVESLIALLVDRNIGAVPVVDHHGWPIGIASKSDVVRWCYERDVSLPETAPTDVIEFGSAVRAIPTATVEDIMMPLAFTLPEDSPIAFAAALMATEGVHHVPVVSADNKVVGMISALDLVGWMAEQEGFTVARRP